MMTGGGKGPGDHAVQHRDPVEIGEVDVEQDHVRGFALEQLQAVGAGVGGLQRAAFGEHEVEGLVERPVVVDEQNFQHMASRR